MRSVAFWSVASLAVFSLHVEPVAAAPKGNSSDSSGSESEDESKAEKERGDASGDEEDASEEGGSNSEVKGSASLSGGRRKAAPTGAAAPAVVGFGPGFYFEETTDIDSSTINGSEQAAQRQDVVSDSFFSLQVWSLFPMFSERVRVGGGLAWFNKYTVYPEEVEEPEDDDYIEYGHMFQVFFQGEYIIPRAVSKLDVLFALRAGGILVFPGGGTSQDLGPTIDDLDRVGYNVWPGPKGGGFVAPGLGGLWPLTDDIDARFEGSVQFGKTWLINAEAEGGGSLLEREKVLNTTRYVLLIGLELGL